MASAGRRPANMDDVARLAGVSHQTVSRVLNGSELVRPQTRDRVLEAIDRLGYRRNQAARALVTRRSHTIGVVSFDTTLFGPASMVHAIDLAARDAGYAVSIVSEKTLDATTIGEALERLAQQAVEGLVIIAPLSETAEAIRELPRDVPVVVVQGEPGSGFATVGVDQADGARLATRHLLDQGVATVWHVCGPAGWLEVEARERGWREELARAGAAIPPPVCGDWSAASGYEVGQGLAERDDIEAVFVANDQMALGVLRAMHEAGCRVPDDVLVVGFDDVPEAGYYFPPLTTIRQDFAEVGRRSMDLLLYQVEGRAPAGRVRADSAATALVPAELVVRRSTTRPALCRRSPRRRS